MSFATASCISASTTLTDSPATIWLGRWLWTTSLNSLIFPGRRLFGRIFMQQPQWVGVHTKTLPNPRICVCCCYLRNVVPGLCAVTVVVVNGILYCCQKCLIKKYYGRCNALHNSNALGNGFQQPNTHTAYSRKCWVFCRCNYRNRVKISKTTFMQWLKLYR